MYGGTIMDESRLQGVPPQQSPSPSIAPVLSSNPPQILVTSNQDICNDRSSEEGGRPKDSACLDCYIPDGKNSRLSQMSPKLSGMLSHAGNLLFIITLCNLMEKYRTPFFGVDRVTCDLYAMEVTSMALIPERVTFMLQVSTSVGVTSQ